MDKPEGNKTPVHGAQEAPTVSRWPLGLAGGLVLLIAVAGNVISVTFGIPERALLYLGLLGLIIIFGRPARRVRSLSSQSALLPDVAQPPSGAGSALLPQATAPATWQVVGKQLLRYMLVGTTTTLLDFGILNLLLQLVPSRLPIQIALYSATSYGTTLVIAYLWHRQWTFRDGERQGSIAWRFVLLNALTLGVNALVVLLLTSVLPLVLPLSALILANLSKGAATLTSGALNFIGNRTWVFQATRPRRQPRLEREKMCDALR